MAEVSTSILSVKEENSMKTFYNLEVAGTDYYHIDVMDGKFVEKNTENLMYEYASNIKKISNLPLDVHLMVNNIKDNIDKYIPLEPHIITFHLEACKDDDEINNLINYIIDNNIKCGISIKPNTPVEKIVKFLPRLFLVLIMTVEPGKGGQALIPETIEKVKETKKYLMENNLDTYIEVDGGINKETAKEAKETGADILVSGSAVISETNFKEVIDILKNN